MVLCVDSTKISDAPEVQKNVDLEDLLTNHVKYFNTEEEALKSRFVPLLFCTSIRTIFSNQVVQVKEPSEDGTSKDMYYLVWRLSEKVPYEGIELSYYVTATGIRRDVFTKFKEVANMMCLESSICQPIGIYSPNIELFNPMVLTHVIFQDDTIPVINKVLGDDCSLVPIEGIDRQYGFVPILDTLIIVKEEEDGK